MLICLHGTSGNSKHWNRLAHFLESSYRVIALDQRGHGESEKPDSGYDTLNLMHDLETFIDKLGISKFSLLGASLGSRVATMYAANHPDVVERLVLIELSFAMPEEAKMRMIRGQLSKPTYFNSSEDALAYSKATRPEWSDEMHKDAMAQDLLTDRDGRLVWAYSIQAAVKCLEQADSDQWDDLVNIRCPTLLVRGEKSNVLTKPTAEKILAIVKDCKFVQIANAAHGVARDNPKQLNQAVSDFLK